MSQNHVNQIIHISYMIWSYSRYDKDHEKKQCNDHYYCYIVDRKYLTAFNGNEKKQIVIRKGVK